MKQPKYISSPSYRAKEQAIGWLVVAGIIFAVIWASAEVAFK